MDILQRNGNHGVMPLRDERVLCKEDEKGIL